MSDNFAIGRHGTFQLRYGWLPKAFNLIEKDKSQKLSEVFTSEDATVNLGVGKNMVASIRYWMRATGVIDENKITEFGRVLLAKYDQYLEDDGSLWLLHLALAGNKEFATSIYWLFYHFHQNEFSVEEASNAFLSYIKGNDWKVSEKTLKMDIQVILRMYAPHKSGKTQTEDMLESPLSLLGLLEYFDGKYHFVFSAKETVPTEIIAYAINAKFVDEKTISVNDLMYGDKAIAPALKLKEDDLIMHLEQLSAKYEDYQLREDAGIFQLHKKNSMNKNKYLEKYYVQTQSDN